MFQYSVASLWFVLIVLLRFTCFFNMFLVIVLLTFPKKKGALCVCFMLLFLYWAFLSGLNCVRWIVCVLHDVFCLLCVCFMCLVNVDSCVNSVIVCVCSVFVCCLHALLQFFLICNFVCFDMCCLCDIFIYTILHIYIYIIVFVCL